MAWLAKMLAPPSSRSLPAAPAASSPGSADFSADFPDFFHAALRDNKAA
jgi:hypothetical protein